MTRANKIGGSGPHHKKVESLLALKGLTGDHQMPRWYKMNTRTTISACVETLTCLLFAIALVFSVPSAANSAFGVDSGVRAATSDYSHDVDSHAHDEMSAMTQHDMPVNAPKTGDEKQSLDQGCAEICISAEISDTNSLFLVQTNEKYLMRHAQTNSIISSGFLRPPQFLI